MGHWNKKHSSTCLSPPIIELALTQPDSLPLLWLTALPLIQVDQTTSIYLASYNGICATFSNRMQVALVEWSNIGAGYDFIIVLVLGVTGPFEI